MNLSQQKTKAFTDVINHINDLDKSLDTGGQHISEIDAAIFDLQFILHSLDYVIKASVSTNNEIKSCLNEID